MVSGKVSQQRLLFGNDIAFKYFDKNGYLFLLVFEFYSIETLLWWDIGMWPFSVWLKVHKRENFLVSNLSLALFYS